MGTTEKSEEGGCHVSEEVLQSLRTVKAVQNFWQLGETGFIIITVVVVLFCFERGITQR